MTDAVTKKIAATPVAYGPVRWMAGIASCVAADWIPLVRMLDRTCAMGATNAFGAGRAFGAYGMFWTATHMVVVAGTFGLAVLMPLLWEDRPRRKVDGWTALALVTVPGLLLTSGEPIF